MNYPIDQFLLEPSIDFLAVLQEALSAPIAANELDHSADPKGKPNTSGLCTWQEKPCAKTKTFTKMGNLGNVQNTRKSLRCSITC